MFKTLESSDKSLRVIETFKTFVSTNNDSGSGVFAVKARSGSFRNYVSSSDENTPIVSGSVTTNFFGQPTHHLEGLPWGGQMSNHDAAGSGVYSTKGAASNAYPIFFDQDSFHEVTLV